MILAVANELRVDAIVMATHGYKGVQRLLLGTVAERVVREAEQPVITIRPRAAAQAVCSASPTLSTRRLICYQPERHFRAGGVVRGEGIRTGARLGKRGSLQQDH